MVTRPTFALIGERGPEAVVPLHRGGGALGGGPRVNVGDVHVHTSGSDLEAVANVAAEKVRARILSSGRTMRALRQQMRGML